MIHVRSEEHVFADWFLEDGGFKFAVFTFGIHRKLLCSLAGLPLLKTSL